MPPDVEEPVDDAAAEDAAHVEAGAAQVLEGSWKNSAAALEELGAVEDEVELEVDEDEDEEDEVHALHAVDDAEEDTQALAGAEPSAHFKSPSAMPAQTSSAEMRFPLSSYAISVGPGTFSVTVQSRLTW